MHDGCRAETAARRRLSGAPVATDTALPGNQEQRHAMLTLVIIFQILGLISAIDAVMKTRTSQGAIAWAVSLLTFPYVAVPAYWVLGRSQFQGMVEARQQNEKAIDELVEQAAPRVASTFVQPDRSIPEYQALVRLSDLGLTASNRTQLLIDGVATYDSILAGISRAQFYVLVEFYIVRDDDIGTRLKNALIERAKEGVRVYFVYDEIGSNALSSAYVDELRANGVSISPFNTTQGLLNRFQLNFRNHRKIVVVDGRSAWVGGLNVGDDYLGGNPKLTPWRDTHLRIDGPAALQAQIAFLSDWYWATRELIDVSWEAHPMDDGEAQVMMIASSPADERETATLFFTHVINSARERLWMTSPYFVPDEGVINALTLAALRGVDVRIIVPGVSDNAAVKAAALFYIQELADTGIRFYEFDKGFLHQKVMLVDNETASVGTANFDIRSFRLNFEITALVHDAGFNREIEAMLRYDMSNSRPVDFDALAAAPYWRQVIIRVARLFAPVL